MGQSAMFPNTITPVIINGTQAHLGTPISFTNDSFYDMANCQSLDKISAISELTKTDFTIFPNPTTGLIQFFGYNDILSVEIISPNGIMINKFQVKETIDLTDLPSGTYFLKIISKGGKRIKKLIKQ